MPFIGGENGFTLAMLPPVRLFVVCLSVSNTRAPYSAG